MTYLRAEWRGQDVTVPWLGKEMIEHFKKREPNKLVSIKTHNGERWLAKVSELSNVREVDV